MAFHPRAVATLVVAATLNADAFAPSSLPMARQQLTRVDIATGIPSADVLVGGSNDGNKEPERKGALIDLDGIKFSVRLCK
mmetsp:Transcript_9790/g.20000  ORF Transcript_9790/g.20000 Transcript_9790/m.20000 type:complete len:81 (-) Transcript_9790:2153-2395(-)